MNVRQYALRAPKRLFTLAMLVGFCLLCPVKVAAAVLPDGTYLIQMSDSDMTVAASSSTQGSRVILWPYKPAATWEFQHLGNDVYAIKTDTMVLDSYKSIKKVGVPIIIWPWHGDGNQRWKVKRTGRYYSLINVATGLAMELQGNNRVKNTPFRGNEPNGSPGQLFKLATPGSPYNPPAPTSTIKTPKPPELATQKREPEKGNHFVGY